MIGRFSKLIGYWIFAIVFACPLYAWGASTWYVCGSASSCNANGGSGWSTGSNSNSGNSKSLPFLTISQGVTSMKSGDTLIIGNGTYTGGNNAISYWQGGQPPAGTSSAWTTIKADVDGYVLIKTGSTSNHCVSLYGKDTNDTDITAGKPNSSPENYITIEGLVCGESVSGRAPFDFSMVDHIKLINCGSFDRYDQTSGVVWAMNSTYLLYQGCYAWGSGRYKFILWHCAYSILRNCVGRQDRVAMTSANIDPEGTYQMYSCSAIEVQNSIAIDGNQPAFWLGVDYFSGAFNNASTTPIDNNYGPVNWTNCIDLNNDDVFGISTAYSYLTTVSYNNCIGWNSQTQSDPYPNGSPSLGSSGDSYLGGYGISVYGQCTFGNVSSTKKLSSNPSAAYIATSNADTSSASTTFNNNIVYNFNSTYGGVFSSFQSWSPSNNDISGCGTLDVANTTP